MNQFIRFVALFFCIACLILGGTILINYLLVKNTQVEIGNDKSILILGDSNSMCAINDTVFDRAVNYSESAAAYFYSYLKLKKVLAAETAIDTVVLSIAPHNVFDNGWFWNNEMIYSNFRYFYPLMDKDDFSNFSKQNVAAILRAIRTIPVEMVRNLLKIVSGKNVLTLGGYMYLDWELLDEDLCNLKDGKQLKCFRIPETFDIAEQEVSYLRKIISLCEENDKNLVLMNMPKREEIVSCKRYGMDEFMEFCRSELPGITQVDYSGVSLPEDSFADLVHLNYQGANWFSQMLKKEGVGGVGSLLNQ